MFIELVDNITEFFSVCGRFIRWEANPFDKKSRAPSAPYRALWGDERDGYQQAVVRYQRGLADYNSHEKLWHESFGEETVVNFLFWAPAYVVSFIPFILGKCLDFLFRVQGPSFEEFYNDGEEALSFSWIFGFIGGFCGAIAGAVLVIAWWLLGATAHLVGFVLWLTVRTLLLPFEIGERIIKWICGCFPDNQVQPEPQAVPAAMVQPDPAINNNANEQPDGQAIPTAVVAAVPPPQNNPQAPEQKSEAADPVYEGTGQAMSQPAASTVVAATSPANASAQSSSASSLPSGAGDSTTVLIQTLAPPSSNMNLEEKQKEKEEKTKPQPPRHKTELSAAEKWRREVIKKRGAHAHKKDKALRDPVHFDLFKDPLFLNCGHHIDLSTFQGMKDSGRTPKCPIDRAAIHYDPKLKDGGLPHDFALKSHIDELRKEKQERRERLRQRKARWLVTKERASEEVGDEADVEDNDLGRVKVEEEVSEGQNLSF